jgi:hypothetical protein
MKPTNNDFVTSRMVSKTSFFFRAHVLAVVFVSCCQAFGSVLRETAAAAGAPEGEQLERQMAADIKAKNWNAVEPESPMDFSPFTRGLGYRIGCKTRA